VTGSGTPDPQLDPAWPADNPPSDRWPIYTRGNIGEVYPEVVLPLEWDFAGRPSERGWRRGAEHIGFAVPSDYGPEDFVIMGVFGGYAYFNASVMRLLGVRTPGLSVDVIDTQFLGDADVPAYSPRRGDRNPAATARMVRSAARTILARTVPRAQEMRKRVDARRAAAPSTDAPDDVLWQFMTDDFASQWEYLIAGHVIITMQATIAAGMLADLCESKLGDPNLAVALMTGIGEVVSAEPAREIWQLANATPPDEFDAAFATFLGRHGHRGPNEFSMAGRDWAAFPEVANAAIDTMRGADPERSPGEQARRIDAERAQVLADARRTMGWQARRLDKAMASTALWSRAREYSKDAVIRFVQPSRHAYLELIDRARRRGGVEDRIGPLLVDRAEFLAYLSDPPSMVSVIEQRRATHERLQSLEPPFAFDAGAHAGGPPAISSWAARRAGTATVQSGQVLTGIAAAPGIARGRARTVSDPGDPAALEPGDVLIAALTDPAWTPLFVTAGAVVVEVGAAMSHAMIVSRELGIPCVVGVADATTAIPDGAEIEVDGQAGTVRIL